MNARTIVAVAVVLVPINVTVRHIVNQIEPAPVCLAPASSSPPPPSRVELDANYCNTNNSKGK